MVKDLSTIPAIHQSKEEGAVSVKRFLVAITTLLVLAAFALSGTASFPWH
jgi:hypothetical protein